MYEMNATAVLAVVAIVAAVAAAGAAGQLRRQLDSLATVSLAEQRLCDYLSFKNVNSPFCIKLRSMVESAV